MANQSVAFLIIFYIIAFIYVKEPHYKYFGYIMLMIVYLASLLVMFQNYSEIGNGFTTMTSGFTMKSEGLTKFIYSATGISMFAIVFFNIYSLFKVLNAYWFRTKTMKSFDLKLSTHHKSNLIRFDNSFIVGNIAFALLIMSFILEPFPPEYQKYIQAVLLFVSFVCVLIEIDYATRFSYIKRD